MIEAYLAKFAEVEAADRPNPQIEVIQRGPEYWVATAVIQAISASGRVESEAIDNLTDYYLSVFNPDEPRP